MELQLEMKKKQKKQKKIQHQFLTNIITVQRKDQNLEQQIL